MCGRYTLIKDDELQKHFDKPIIGGYAVNPRYNVAPGQNAPIVTAQGIEVMRWGLVPQWAKSLNDGYKMINARSESLLERPAYKGLVKGHRCLIPASGFYEWLKTDTGRQPYYFSVKDEVLISLAGLYTQRTDPEGHVLKSFTIITTKPNALVAKVHDRMPVIFTKEEEDLRLDESITDPAEVLPMLDAFPAKLMESYAVSTDVNSGRIDSPDLINRLKDPPR